MGCRDGCFCFHHSVGGQGACERGCISGCLGGGGGRCEPSGAFSCRASAPVAERPTSTNGWLFNRAGLDSDYSSLNSKEFCDKLFNDYIKGTKPKKTEAVDDICNEIEIDGEWDFDYDTGYNKILRIDLKNWFIQYNRWEYFAILKREIGMKKKKYKNLIEQIKTPYICSIDDGSDLHDILMSNERLFHKILLNINNNH